MATSKDPFANLGLEFMNWQSVPSITEALKGGKSPLLNLLGIAFAGGEKPSEPSGISQGLGQGISAPIAPPIGINPNAGGLGISPESFKLPNLTLPQIGSPMMPAQNVDLDGDGKVDNFWGLKK
jgi:hypothetical protein